MRPILVPTSACPPNNFDPFAVRIAQLVYTGKWTPTATSFYETPSGEVKEALLFPCLLTPSTLAGVERQYVERVSGDLESLLTHS